MDETQIPIRSLIDYTVIGTDTDVLDRLTPQALYGYKQESATLHAYHLGMPEFVDKANGAWLLRRSRARWFTRPSFRDVVTVETWSRGVSLVTFLRDFRFYVNGNMNVPAGIGSSEWIIADKDAHKPLRPLDVFPSSEIARRSVSEWTMDEKSPRLTDPAVPLEHVLTRDIGYSDLDHNHHVNNTFYLRYGIDAMAKTIANRGRLQASDLDICETDVVYMRELGYGDTIELYTASDAGGWYVEGRKQDGERCFRMRLKPF